MYLFRVWRQIQSLVGVSVQIIRELEDILIEVGVVIERDRIV